MNPNADNWHDRNFPADTPLWHALVAYEDGVEEGADGWPALAARFTTAAERNVFRDEVNRLEERKRYMAEALAEPNLDAPQACRTWNGPRGFCWETAIMRRQEIDCMND